MKLATLCYLQTKTHTLMLHRAKRPTDYHYGKWNGLGGKFLPGETPEECVVREVEEECGLAVNNPQLIGFISFPLLDEKEDWFVFVFYAEEFSGDLRESTEGNLKWIKNEELLSLEMWEGDRIFLPWILERRFFSAKFVYLNGRLNEHCVTFY